MKVLNLFSYVMPGRAIGFNDLYNLGKVRKYYADKDSFEIDLESAIDSGLVGIKRIDDKNYFYKI